jgi:hypothetical protein
MITRPPRRSSTIVSGSRGRPVENGGLRRVDEPAVSRRAVAGDGLVAGGIRRETTIWLDTVKLHGLAPAAPPRTSPA